MAFKHLLATAAIMFAAGSADAANLIVNGGFENPTVPNNDYANVNVHIPSIPGWNSTNVDIVNNFLGFGAYQGMNWLDLVGFGSTGSISQTFNTVSGRRYLLTFAYSHNSLGGLGSASGLVSVGNLSRTVTHSTGNASNPDYQIFSRTFTATGPTSTLSFVTTAGGGNAGLALDAVSVSAVPETATWAMLIGGFGAMGCALRTRRRSALATA